VPDLLIVVPTRERPGNARALLATLRDTCVADTAVTLAVDATDPTIEEYQRIPAEQAAGRLPVAVHVVDPPAGHVGAINAAALAAVAGPGRPWAVVKLDDDHRPRTYGWDRLYLDALRLPRVGIVYGDDLIQGERLPTAPGIRSDIIAALGWMGPPVLHHLYVDNAWRALADAAGCRLYLPGVVVEHCHPIVGRAAWDDVYDRANSPHRYAADGDAWRAWKSQHLAAAAETARRVIAAHDKEPV
jgi:hypothetical protein